MSKNKWITSAFGILFVMCFVGLNLMIIKSGGSSQKETGKDETVKSEYVGENEPNKGTYTKLVVAFDGKMSDEDLLLVEEEVNKITREQIGVEIEFKTNAGQYNQTIATMLTGEEQLDIAFMSTGLFRECYMGGELYEIDNLLKGYGQDILAAVDHDNIEACRVNGKLYGLPTNKVLAAGWDGYVLRKETLDKYGIDKNTIQSVEDLERVFEIVKKGEPDMVMVAPNLGSMLFSCYLKGSSEGGLTGIHLNYGQDKEILNLFETQEYLDALKRVRSWYQKDYMGTKILEQTETIKERVKEGKLLSYPQTAKPGIELQESLACETEMVLVQFGKNAISSNSVASMTWNVLKNTVSPEKSMQLLNLMYSNADIMNLLSYGVKGIHYVLTEDGHVTFPQGVTYNAFAVEAWMMPNQFITYVWEGNPLSHWEIVEQYNKEAIKACDIGFKFDLTGVLTEYEAISKIYQRYRLVLENGLVDPVEGIAEMMAEMKKENINWVIENKKQQFKEWSQSK